jgi:hypothetical protein
MQIEQPTKRLAIVLARALPQLNFGRIIPHN